MEENCTDGRQLMPASGDTLKEVQEKGGEVNQLLLLRKQRSTVLNHSHNEIGHLGVDRVFAFARNRYFCMVLVGLLVS